MRRQPWRLGAALVALLATLTTVAIVVGPFFVDPSTFGFHDWDVETSFRYLTKVSLLRYHELPGWNPYACGGYPHWGYVEGATTVVSPWLPAYLLLPLSVALRVETVGMALLGAAGAYVVAACFTRSHAARLLVVALWAVNGRWALQTASGHTWHLAYAWMPWCLYGYERARLAWRADATLLGRGSPLWPTVGTGAAFAMLVYSGGIYPLPHTVLLVGCYAAICCVQERSARPLVALGVAGLVALGLAAPKLLPLLDTFSGDPRLIESTERLDLGALVTLLTSRDQAFSSRPAKVSPYGWHEWGMYISWAGLLVLVVAFILVEGRRERALKLVGALLVLLGLGAFHPAAPWPWFHEHLPVFGSQHVPSRFLYPAVLVLGLVAAAGLGRVIERRRRRWPWLDLGAALLVALLAFDVARVARLPMASAMWMKPPAIPSGRTFHFEKEPPFQYVKRDWAGPMLLAMMGNTGVLNCYGVPRSPDRPIAALASDDPRYAGEVRVLGEGTARLLEWTPNSVRLQVDQAGADSRLVLNMNHRRGWRSDVGPVQPQDGLVSLRLPPGSREVRVWYRPPGLGSGLALASLTLSLVGLWWWRARRIASGGAPDLPVARPRKRRGARREEAR